MKEKRFVWLDVAKGFGILFVIYGHACREFTMFNQWICSFFMPLFFLCSGFTYRLKKDFLKYNIKHILLPYYFWGSIGVLFGMFTRWNEIAISISSVGIYLLKFLLGITMENYPLWFLVSFFAGKTVYDMINCSVKKMNVCNEKFQIGIEVVCVVVLAIIGYIYAINKRDGFSFYRFDTGLIMLPFLCVGRYVKDLINKLYGHKKVLICLTPILLAINILTGCFLNELVSVNSNEYGNIVLFFASALAGCFAIWGLSRLLEMWDKPSAVIAWLGKNSIEIMGSHMFILCILVYVSKIIFKTSVSEGLLTLLCVFFEIPVVCLLDKLRNLLKVKKIENGRAFGEFYKQK